MYHFELIRKNGIVVTLRKWSEKLWFFEVTEEIKEKHSQWYSCRTLKRTLPIYHLGLINTVLKGNRYKNFFHNKAEKLYVKYQIRQ
ncbi:hypothetical protein BK128_21355 [Viridibacillus sp. FSL H7-0596]|nr:hypothetical protein BK128_21355 [Viridibacillus sp. FSL H7-0596]